MHYLGGLIVAYLQATDPASFDWVNHLITALVSAITGGGIVAYMKVRAENKATLAAANKTDTEAGSEIVDQAKAVVEMWQAIGNQLQQKVKDLESRIQALEASEAAKAERIRILEDMNKKKDARIAELEAEVARLRVEVERPAQARKGRG